MVVESKSNYIRLSLVWRGPKSAAGSFVIDEQRQETFLKVEDAHRESAFTDALFPLRGSPLLRQAVASG